MQLDDAEVARSCVAHKPYAARVVQHGDAGRDILNFCRPKLQPRKAIFRDSNSRWMVRPASLPAMDPWTLCVILCGPV
jgi:hypothetical protein